uniref:Uncharacterized protein n=1 Tax=Triticum urartu TaxID=4572 RepID=A0A8R7PSS2_TRIUA
MTTLFFAPSPSRFAPKRTSCSAPARPGATPHVETPASGLRRRVGPHRRIDGSNQLAHPVVLSARYTL